MSMAKSVGIALACGLLAGQLLAEVEPVFVGKPHDALFAAQQTERGLVAVGAAGQYSYSVDGKQWESERIAPPTMALLAISELRSNALAVGQSGVIMRRDSKGWSKIDSPSKERLMSVAQHDGGLALAVGGFGAVLKSQDGGASWKSVKVDWEALIKQPYEPHIYSVMFNARGEAYMVGEFGMIARSLDGGDSWEAVHLGDESVFGLAMNSEGQGMAVGQSGLALATTDFGHTWRAVDSGTKAILLDVAVRSDGSALASGIREAVYFSPASEQAKPLSVAPFLESWFADIAILNEEFYLVGQRAQIVKVDL